MSCYDNIVPISAGCADTVSLSGLYLMDAPEISSLNLAKEANEDYVSGLALATAKRDLALTLVKNDLMSVMAANNVVPNILATRYDTGVFKPDVTFGAEAVERGLTVYRNSRIRGNLRKTVIHYVQIYPLVDAENVEFKIYDDGNGGTVTTYSFDLTGGEVNKFTLEYTIIGTYARLLLDGTEVSVASSYLTCFTGCHGAMPNDCGYTKGWFDDKEIQAKEGYGIVANFSCACNYDELLCGLARTFIGELIWYKARILLMEEHIRSNRLNNWIIYNREDSKEYLVDLENQYRTKWNTFAGSLYGVLRQYHDDCLDCRNTKWVNNI